MKYITHKRFKGKGITGDVNLPVFTELRTANHYLVYGTDIICADKSENAHLYFARNDDGNGIERGKLTRAIKSRLSKKDDAYQDRWDRVWEDQLCLKYKRPEFDDFFLWNHEFYNAPIEDLRYIAGLIGAKGGTT